MMLKSKYSWAFLCVVIGLAVAANTMAQGNAQRIRQIRLLLSFPSLVVAAPVTHVP